MLGEWKRWQPMKKRERSRSGSSKEDLEPPLGNIRYEYQVRNRGASFSPTRLVALKAAHGSC